MSVPGAAPYSASTATKDLNLVALDDPILVTGASGFIGRFVIKGLLDRGFRHIRGLVRSSATHNKLRSFLTEKGRNADIELIQGNLLSREDCLAASKNAVVVYHLAAGRGEKSFPDAFLNSVVTTRNLLEVLRGAPCLKRIVTVSTFSVYTNQQKNSLLDESSPIEVNPAKRGDAYTFAKTKQDQLVVDYGEKYSIPYVIVRPGVVYGPGNEAIPGRVGIGTFGLFLHLGGSNPIPLTYVENCAEAIILAGLRPGVEREVFNVTDEPVLSSREFLKLYKKNVQSFRSIYLPHSVSYLLCYLWEKYSAWSQGQLPPIYNRSVWHAYWKKTCYSNRKVRAQLGWTAPVPVFDALNSYFASCRRSKGLD